MLLRKGTAEAFEGGGASLALREGKTEDIIYWEEDDVVAEARGEV